MKHFKDWLSKHPGIVKMLRCELTKSSRVGAKTIFRPQSVVMVCRSQVAYRPELDVAIKQVEGAETHGERIRESRRK